MELCWTAIYKDGTEYNQLNADKSENRYENIDRSQLNVFQLRDVATGAVVVQVLIQERQRLIWRRRIFKKGNHQLTVHLVGWQKTFYILNSKTKQIEKRNMQAIFCVFPTGQIIVADRWNESDQLFHSVALRQCETEGK